MAQGAHRLVRAAADPLRVADRARLLERVAVGLAHEGKNPLHNMVLHVQLMAEKIGGGRPAEEPALPATGEGRRPQHTIDKHLAALRDGIGRVDALLKCFGEFASPEHLQPDLGGAVTRAVQLFGYDARRASVQLVTKGPAALLVAADPRWLTDLVAHALVAALELSRDGGTVELSVHPDGLLRVTGDGGLPAREAAAPHVDALRRLAPDAGAELSIETPPAGGARLSLSFRLPR